MTIALCAVLVAPRAWRGAVAAAGAAFALTAGVGVLVMEWHYASDVAAGYLVATGWTLLAVAALRPLERPAPAQAPARGGPWGWIVAAAIAAALAAQVSAGSLASFAADHTWAALTTAGLCVMAAALAASLAAVLRR